MTRMRLHGAALLVLGLPLLTMCAELAPMEARVGTAAAAADAVLPAGAGVASIPVSGTAIHYFSTAIIHSQEPTATGLIQRSTDIIRLMGDVDGYVLYHPTSVIDVAANTLVNTGTQIFSGTVAGAGPVILHDDRFRFEVDLATGATTGEVHLSRSVDAPHKGGWFECRLTVTGTGVTPEGDNLSNYTGTCTERGNMK